jgi:hypothetical protein
VSEPIREGSQRGNLNPAPTTPKPSVAPKAQGRGNIPRDSEIEGIKRTLYNAIDKLEKIQRRDAELTTT